MAMPDNRCPFCFETVSYGDWYVTYRKNATHVECLKLYKEWRAS